MSPTVMPAFFQHANYVAPGKLRLAHDICGQVPVGGQPWRTRSQEPAKVGAHLDGVAVVFDLTGDTDFDDCVVHRFSVSAKNFLKWSVISRPLKGEAPTIDLVVGYHKANTSPILRTFPPELMTYPPGFPARPAERTGIGRCATMTAVQTRAARPTPLAPRSLVAKRLGTCLVPAAAKIRGGERRGNAGTGFRQARSREASASEPLQRSTARAPLSRCFFFSAAKQHTTRSSFPAAII